MQPFLSIVVTSRNDFHGGDILKRMRIFVNGLLHQSRRHNRQVATLFEGPAQAQKTYELDFTPQDLKKGIYTARLDACGNQMGFIKLIYLD